MRFADTAKFKLINILITFSLMGIAGVSLCHAQQPDKQDATPSDNALQPAEHIFNLQHKQRDFNFYILNSSINKKVKFEKEPDFSQRNIVRGLIPFGSNEKNYIGFAWDRINRKLYIDLNRNKDLTDDPNGIFESKDRSSFQYFRDIQLSIQKGTLILPYTIEMRMSYYGGDSSYSVTIRSGYSADIELDGKRWHVGIVDNMNGDIAPGDHFILSPLDLDFSFPKNSHQLRVPRSIFLDSYNYDVSFEFQPGTKTPKLQLRLKESIRPMGKLNIEGEHIARLVLESRSSTVLLHYPQQNVSIPVGDYHCSGVYLYCKDVGLFNPQRVFGTKKESISVTEDGLAILKAGGPLKNIVEINRSGTTLKLDYKLIGIDNKSYTRFGGRIDRPPTFTIYKGNKEIVSDKFEYG